MSSGVLPPAPPSPGVGARRKGPKGHVLPTLPLSAFTPPNSGTSEQFPRPPSPSTIQPEKVIDANVIAPTRDLSRWKKEIGQELNDEKIGGVVINLTGVAPDAIEKAVAGISASSTSMPVVGILVPFSLENGAPDSIPAYLSGSSQPPVILASTYAKSTPKAVEALNWALTNGFSVDLDIQANLRDGEGEWEALEDFFANAIPRSSPIPDAKVFLSNLLPPPDDFSLPIVKLLTHPTYQAYQSHTAALSLYSNVFIKFLPPVWGTPTPPTPAPTQTTTPSSSDATTPGGASAPSGRDTTEKKEWKRRIKMYIGPALEAFGFQRIIYGSSPSPLSHSASNAGDWYELARESFAELGVEQEGVDAVFYGNAKRAFGLS
ncbi:unnamed protein product [Somion occarium]|uniref:Amidohydrolase-related domain-containing protein n=1 Tax=Somion occarium TaxID=3059160 RepID=A0ABP1DNJ5_9APHY